MLTLSSKTTALVLIDLQEGILPFAKAPYTGAEIVERSAQLVAHFHQQQALIVRVRVGWSASYREALQQLTDLPMGQQPLASNWWNYPQTLPLKPNEIEVTKRQWGAFYGTDLELQLRRRGIDTLVIGGISTNIGVESTARNAWELGFSLVIASDLCSAASAEQHNSSMQWIFPRIARVRNSAEIIDALL